MIEQVERLRELNQLDHVDIRVLPFSTGAHAAMLGAFAVMDFEVPDDPPLAYVETYSGAGSSRRPSILPGIAPCSIRFTSRQYQSRSTRRHEYYDH